MVKLSILSSILFISSSMAVPMGLLDELLLDKRDHPTPPTALPQVASAEQIRFQPAMDFDKDGCYNVPAIDKDGNIAVGRSVNFVSANSGCRDLSDLQNNNVYVRSRCNNGWCKSNGLLVVQTNKIGVHLYDYYFEKDVALENFFGWGSHRHDWEHVAVWTKNKPRVATSAYGGYNFKPVGKFRQVGDHPKIIYHKDGIRTHCFRFANKRDDKIENHTHQWFFGALVDYYWGFPSVEIRDKLMSHDFGDAGIAIKDLVFMAHLQAARPNANYAPEFNPAIDQ